jgi:hypothetical protein
VFNEGLFIVQFIVERFLHVLEWTFQSLGAVTGEEMAAELRFPRCRFRHYGMQEVALLG